MVHLDQNGFVQGGQGYHNILRRVLNILFEKSGSPGHAVLSLDAEEDFDRIEWRCLFKILDRFGLASASLLKSKSSGTSESQIMYSEYLLR